MIEQRSSAAMALQTPTTTVASRQKPYIVLYDAQCEACQASVSWLKTLDDQSKTVCLPISAQALSNLDARLNLDDCLTQLHVLSPEGAIYVGWDAVACLARLFPSTRLIGVLGQFFPLRNLGLLLYRLVAANRYSLSKCRGGACRVRPAITESAEE
jgi:predicted DCC family thiol-disulfide oxidoreductase YuxK